MQNIYFYTIIGIYVIFFIFDKFVDYLNTLNWSPKLPEEAKGIYDEEKYAKSQDYEKTKFSFSKITSTFSFVLMLLILSFGGFGILDSFLRNYISNPILLSLAFFGIIILAQTIISLPFSYYSTFVIEEKFGFNKMTMKIFIIDSIKSLILTMILGGIISSVIIYLYIIFGTNFWILARIFMASISLFFTMFYSSLIVPLFNKQTPLEDGELKTSINNFAQKVGFKLDNIFVIDGSKRSSKANAYFTGIGAKKRIVLYDTLINDLTTDELVAVLAHEIGHYKKKHVWQMIIISTIETGFMLFLFSLM
ncbi:MAG: M48 family metallopeptidase, partial [Candidatus Gracilibacteria bacterium]|nr:M48 family metallopeptidase [Candidatus Gracilibacteria bacterium]